MIEKSITWYSYPFFTLLLKYQDSKLEVDLAKLVILPKSYYCLSQAVVTAMAACLVLGKGSHVLLTVYVGLGTVAVANAVILGLSFVGRAVGLIDLRKIWIIKGAINNLNNFIFHSTHYYFLRGWWFLFYFMFFYWTLTIILYFCLIILIFFMTNRINRFR